jgi:general secretion pathway protein B
MSTILDSLKKSSNQRNDNEKSSLDGFKFGSSSNSKTGNLRLLFWIFFIIISVFVTYWFGFREIEYTGESELIETPNQTAQQVSKENKLNIKNNRLANGNKKAKPNSEEVKKQLNQKQPVSQSQNPDQAVVAKQKPENNKAEENRAQAEIKNDSAQQPKVEPNKESDNNDSLVDSQPIKSQNEQSVIKEVPEMIKQQEYPFVYQLPFNIRKEIPKIKLNIHIYDQNKESRLVVVNGENYEIGDLIEETLLIHDIVPEGLVLDFNGQKFLIPKL